MKLLRRMYNIIKYGVGERAREKKRADKQYKKEAAFQSDRWDQREDLARRRYASYDEYVEHQASKLDKVIDRLQENQDEVLQEFLERFRTCSQLQDVGSVLCLGARLGTEVQALHLLGHFAVGVDLNPGPNNSYVLPGDFHKLVFADDSVDGVYTNTLDHVFDLEKFVSEIRRVLRPRGIFLAEFEVGFEEGHIPGAFESLHWRDSEELTDRLRGLGGLGMEQLYELGETRRGQRKLVVFRKDFAEQMDTAEAAEG